MKKIFEPNTIADIRLKNRIIMEPMCMYAVDTHDGVANTFHQVHYASRAVGGVGLIIVEATGISPAGRITDSCLGLYNDKQEKALEKVVQAVHQSGSKIIIQLNHIGRKSRATTGVSRIVAPSVIPYSERYRTPDALSADEIQSVINDFCNSIQRALRIGFDGVEIHAAHGYLLSQFMSPISNKRTDAYKDGSILLKQLTLRIQEFWPKDKILSIRVSSTDFEEHGLDVHETIRQLQDIAPFFDLINVSTGGITTTPPHKIFPGYQIQDAYEIKKALKRPTIGCGLLGDFALADYLIESQTVDYIGLARPLLEDPYWVMHRHYELDGRESIIENYKRAYK